jgi:uncharacterized membrane protein YfcA
MKIILEVTLGFLVGCAIGLTGVGGGVLILPALVQILKIPPVPAVGTGMLYTVVSRIVGSISHFTLKTIRWRRSLLFLVGGIPGVVVASLKVNDLVKVHQPDIINKYLQDIIGIIALIAAGTVILQLFSVNDERRNHRIEQSRIMPVPLRERVSIILMGSIVGVLIGATSVGGGVFIIPLFILLFNANTKQAIGTSIFISTFLSLLGALVYFFNGNVDITTSLLLCLGTLAGVPLGCKLADRIPETALIIIVTIIAGLSGISMFF